ncbi:hypothetical protein [Flavobacterium sp. 3HN19-14]|uniref:hypothetical protein n=1 Tax=Flavobacterium sp. 3HN19-14 TaxID=3448133 RepID=UPI003EE36EE5
MKNFSTAEGYKSEEKKFISKLSGDTKEAYEFFCKHYDTFFNKIGDGFFVNINNERLMEKETIRENGRSAKKITFSQRGLDDDMPKVIRAFPLLYKSPKNNNALAIQYVCFIDGFIRNSIDYFDKGKILRIYLPVFNQNELTMAASTKVYKATTFTANENALVNFLKNNQISLHFNPDFKPFESNLKLEEVKTKNAVRGCSIY